MPLDLKGSTQQKQKVTVERMSIASIVLTISHTHRFTKLRLQRVQKQSRGKPAPIPPKNVEAGEEASQARMSTCISYGVSQ